MSQSIKPIVTTADLDHVCHRIAASSSYIAIDTEFIRESTYWPRLCLVQIAGAEDAVVIDPMAEGIDLAPLFGLLRDRSVLKVFHSARQDVEIFVKLMGEVPGPLFDTQIAAMVCGFGDQVGYEALIMALTGDTIDKTSRFTDWSHRPLTDRQLAYALADVVHLRPAYEALAARIDRRGRAHWVADEMAELNRIETYVTQPEDAWRRLKVRSHEPKFLAVLREVAAWREIEAQKRDIPRGRLIRDETLVEIAAHAPRSSKELARSRGISGGMAEGWQGQGLLAAVERGLACPPDQRPRMAERRRLPNNIGPTVELLRVLLKLRCDGQEVAQRLVASASDLELIAADDDADVPALSGWRREVFGEDAIALKQGRVALAIENRRVKEIRLHEPERTAAQ